MQAYPLPSLSVAEAKQFQFALVDLVTQNFSGQEVLTLGDLGIVTGENKPISTLKVERIIADFFQAEKAILVQGAGTAAIRWGLYSMMKPGQTLLVHDAPMYPTTAVTIQSMGIQTVTADFNDWPKVLAVLENNQIDGVVVQHSRQQFHDSYYLAAVIAGIKRYDSQLPILVDDNYAVMKVAEVGVQCGADLSAFSLFKLLGPEGVGCVVGKKDYIEVIQSANSSGGSQIQGHLAMEALRGLLYAPVACAIQAEVSAEIVGRLCGGEVPGIREAFLANSQSKVVMIVLENPIGKEVIAAAATLGAAPYPVGAESKYEFVPMVYRVSQTLLATDPGLIDVMIRVNPMRAGADTVIRILRQAIARVVKKRE